MNKSAFIAIAATLFGLIGCATTPVTTVKPTPIPPERTLGLQTNVKNGATIVVNRDSEFLSGGGCLLSIVIDDKTAANIAAGESGRFFVEPGRHKVGIARDTSAASQCSEQLNQPLKQSTTELKSGQQQNFRISGGKNTVWDIRPTGL